MSTPPRTPREESIGQLNALLANEICDKYPLMRSVLETARDLLTEGVKVEVQEGSTLKMYRVKPGDVFVFRTTQQLSTADKKDLRGRLGGLFPGHKALILDGGSELELVSREKT